MNVDHHYAVMNEDGSHSDCFECEAMGIRTLPDFLYKEERKVTPHDGKHRDCLQCEVLGFKTFRPEYYDTNYYNCDAVFDGVYCEDMDEHCIKCQLKERTRAAARDMVAAGINLQSIEIARTNNEAMTEDKCEPGCGGCAECEGQ